MLKLIGLAEALLTLGCHHMSSMVEACDALPQYSFIVRLTIESEATAVGIHRRKVFPFGKPQKSHVDSKNVND